MARTVTFASWTVDSDEVGSYGTFVPWVGFGIPPLTPGGLERK
jgi:hypothetical protein